MKHQNLLVTAMTILVLGIWCLAPPRPVQAATAAATLEAVTVSTPAQGEELLLRIAGDYAFTTNQVNDSTLVVELVGVDPGAVPKQNSWATGILAGYHLSQADEGSRSVLRVELALKHPAAYRVHKTLTGLWVTLGEPQNSSAPAQAAASGKQPPAAPAASQEQARATGPARIRDISIHQDSQGQAVVQIATSGRVKYNVFRLDNPARLVVDFEGARKATSRSSYPSSSPLLSEVRVGQFKVGNPSVVRVVADLAGNPVYDVTEADGSVRLVLKPRSENASAPAATPAPAAEKAKAEPVPPATPQPAKVSEPAPVAEKAVPAPAVPAATLTSATKPSAEFRNTLPTTPLAAPQAAPKPKALAPAIPQPDPGEAAAKIMAGSTLTADEVAQGQTGAGSEEPKYTGEPISLNLKNVDLKDFFRLIHEISGLNIIVDPNVSGTVTLVLDNVPWDQALDIVLKNNQLGKVLEGNVLRIAKLDTLTAEQGQVVKLAEARLEAQPLVTRFVAVNYAKAATIAAMLKSWVGGGALSKRGSVLVDDRTNTLIISDITSQIPVIEEVIKKLDTKTKQVAIEARIEQVTKTFSRTLAAALALGAVNASGSTVQTAETGSGSSVTQSIATPRPVKVTDQTLTGFGIYAVSNVGARYILNAMLAAEEAKANAKTLSKPTIVTQNNVAGTVVQGTQIPIQTTINNTISIQYIQASLQLTVTPQITADGNVFMVINVTNSSPGPVLTTAGPSINTQSATTQVLVPDGGTVVFGGVTINAQNNSATYVPLLGKIPILGHLFKSSLTSNNDSELLFFVTPKVLPT